ANPKSKKKVKNGKKATFRRGHGKRPKGPKGAEGGVDADSDHASAPHDDDEVSDHDPSDSEGSYRGYSLKGIPSQARPSSNSLGAHSYTVKRGDARIEVLLRQRAFYVKGGVSGPHVAWSKFPTISDAWICACTRAGVLP
ncbi:unnamed protein product, partial [Cladocopium goreaui]